MRFIRLLLANQIAYIFLSNDKNTTDSHLTVIQHLKNVICICLNHLKWLDGRPDYSSIFLKG